MSPLLCGACEVGRTVCEVLVRQPARRILLCDNVRSRPLRVPNVSTGASVETKVMVTGSRPLIGPANNRSD